MFLPKLFEPNDISFKWASELIEKMTWANHEDPFRGKPTLILVGENDKEVPSQTLAWLQTMAEKHSHVHLHIIPGAPHDVLTPFKIRATEHQPDFTYDPSYAHSLIQLFLIEQIVGKALYSGDNP